VLRNGKTVKVFDEVSDQITDKIISAMVGREITELFPEKEKASNKKLFEVIELSGRGFSQVNFEVAAGEVLGIAGLVGSGREQLIDTIYGLLPKSSGAMILKEEAYNPTRPSKAVKAGVALVPRDRRNDGLVLDQPVVDNINLASLDEVSVALMEKRAVSKERAEVMVKQLDLRPRNVMTIPRLLSGGNQQKVVLGRWLAKGGDLFILDEPTVGVDVGAKVEIYNLIRELARGGSAVIVSSGDPLELLGLSDRIMVLRRGYLAASSDVKDLNVDSLVGLTTGGNEGLLE
jgi:ribose transport system ATP-binding protein